MKHLLLSLLLGTFYSFGQTVIWSENFDPAPAWTMNVATGTNGSDPNFFQIDDDEGGVLPNGCGVANNGDQTLHVTSVFNPTGGAAYDAGGLCGLLFCPETDTRTESTVISTVGSTNLTLTFDYILGGDPGNDYGLVWYNDGTGWTILDTPTPTPTCGSGQGQWTVYSFALPASCENNPNLQIGFGWVNNDDAAGSDPSFAINNVAITTPSTGSNPTADFSTLSTTICVGDCIDFSDASTLGTNPQWDWDFGNTQTSTAQNPLNICYNTAGTYTVSLTVTDDDGTDTEIKTDYITVVAPPSAGLDGNGGVCNNTTLDLNTILSGNDSGGSWTETTGSPSGQFNTSTGVFDASGLTPGTFTFEYTVSGGGTCPDDVAQIQVQVNDCSQPTASFTPSSTSGCSGIPIVFTDNSTGSSISSWNWNFDLGSPGTASTQGPHTVTFASAGTYNVNLSVTDANGTDDTTIVITIVDCTVPVADFTLSADTICASSCITISDNSLNADSYSWTFTGGQPASSTSSTPGQVCYLTPGNYTVDLTVSNSFGSDTHSLPIVVVASPSLTVSNDTIIEFGGTAVLSASGDAGTYLWSPSESLDCSDCATVNATPSNTTEYSVTLTNSNGCSTFDFVTVEVELTGIIGVPNTFSPNANGNNDVLYVKGDGITEMLFRIYNRYGQLLFESDSQNVGWDGTVNGLLENPGTFVYTLEYTLINGVSGELNGNVTLIR